MPPDLKWGPIAAFRLVTTQPARLITFYEAIGCTALPPQPIGAAEMRLLGLEGKGERWRLRIGDTCLDLDVFDPPGRPYPAAASAADMIFQHLAFVTSDAGAAWARAEAAGASPISDSGPVTLPPRSGGVTAVKFRDPDGHPLEFLEFPQGTHPIWQGSGILGIDHSAISVNETAASIAFYRAAGLDAGDETLNHGPSQEALDHLPDVRVQVVPMNPPKAPPHLELLGYRQPRGRTHPPLAANDIAATRVVWHAGREALIDDPDGHLHQLMWQDRSPADIA